MFFSLFSVILIGGGIKKGKWYRSASKAEQLSKHLFSILKAGAFLLPKRRHFQKTSKPGNPFIPIPDPCFLSKKQPLRLMPEGLLSLPLNFPQSANSGVDR